MAVELKLILLPQPVQSKNKLSLAISVTKRRLVCPIVSLEHLIIVLEEESLMYSVWDLSE